MRRTLCTATLVVAALAACAVNPATGGYPIPSISTFIQFLPKGFKTAPYRSTDANERRGRKIR